MGKRVVVLGAGFGGLELSTILSEELGTDVDVTLIDKDDAYSFGYSKLDVMFGYATPEAVRMPYRDLAKPGVRLLRETVTAIDPEARRVTTDAAVHEGDVLVIALGADYDMDATPGLAEAGHEFYSLQGAARLATILPAFSEGRVVIGVCGHPFKCPPAPSACALLLDDMLTERGVREACEITFVIPMGQPVPPSPDASDALRAEFAKRDITLITESRVTSLDPERKVALLADGGELPFDLFLGVPKHRAPDAVIAAGLAEEGFVPVDPATLQTRFPGVYAIGDVAAIGVPKAGVFAEGAARTVAERVIADVRGGEGPGPFPGRGACFIEWGRSQVGRVDVDFFSGPERTQQFSPPSEALAAERERFGSSRRERWFGT